MTFCPLPEVVTSHRRRDEGQRGLWRRTRSRRWAGKRGRRGDQGGEDGGFDPGVDLSRDGLMAHQATARTVSHGSVAGGRSHGGQGFHATLGRFGGNGAHGGGAQGADRRGVTLTVPESMMELLRRPPEMETVPEGCGGAGRAEA